MRSDENAFQSYIHIHLDHLCAVVMHCVMHEVFIFTVATLISYLYLHTLQEISARLDDSPA